MEFLGKSERRPMEKVIITHKLLMRRLFQNWILLVTFLFFFSCGQKNKMGQALDVDSTFYRGWANFRQDTSKYLLDNFYYHQNQYRNKSLGFFLQKLELPIVYYCPIYQSRGMGQSASAKDSCIGITLGFFNYDKMFQKINRRINPAILGIYFKNILL